MRTLEERTITTELAEAMDIDLGSLNMLRKAAVYRKRLRLQWDKMRRAIKKGILTPAQADRWRKLCKTSAEDDNLSFCEYADD